MLTIRKKYGGLLSLVFIISILLFNFTMDMFFYERFKAFVSEDMMRNYSVSSKNLEDYILINKVVIENVLDEDTVYKVLKFIVDRVYCDGALFDLEGNVLATAITGDGEIDIDLLTSVPSSFKIAKENKAVLDIERKARSTYGKLSYSIYDHKFDSMGILVLVKDYSGEFNRNTATKNLINIIATSIFTIVFIIVYNILSKVVRPIVKLKDKVSEISNGRYPEIMPATSGDEIGVLIKAFNSMSEKLRLKDEQEKSIFRNITHELKTPLASISGYAQILLDNYDEAFKEKSLKRIISESNRMHELVITLLDISKQSSDLVEFSFENVNINEIIKNVILTQLPKIDEKNLRIVESVENLTLKGNKQYLSMLFSNLIDNGIKYSNVKSEISIQLKQENEKIIFSIITEGKAIPEGMKEKIFEPFIRVESGGFKSKDSHGLGLYICKNIVLAHKGEISVIVQNNTSKFVVKFPSVNTLETT